MTEHNGTMTEHDGTTTENEPTTFKGMTLEQYLSEHRERTEERVRDFLGSVSERVERMREQGAKDEERIKRGFLALALLLDARFSPSNYDPTYITLDVESFELPRVAAVLGSLRVRSKDLETFDGVDMVRVYCACTDYPEVTVRYLSPIPPGSKCRVIESVHRSLACDL